MFILRRIQRDAINFAYVFMQITRYSCKILMNLELSLQFFEKSSNIKFK